MLRAISVTAARADHETLPHLQANRAIESFDAMWRGFESRRESLEIEILKEWEHEGVMLGIVRCRIGVIKGTKARACSDSWQRTICRHQSLPGERQRICNRFGRLGGSNQCAAIPCLTGRGKTLLGQQDGPSTVQTDNRLGRYRRLSRSSQERRQSISQCPAETIDTRRR